ncbi:MAG: FAD-dependent oxidoreductase, partial [Chloroflexota bacterium]|nr:FAD-dependent oxidoreductase [Chloroflexota bacterium]
MTQREQSARSTDSRDVEIAIVGGGPAGAALARRLAAAGHEVALFERLPRPRWRASGVYSSPLTRVRLARLGLSDQQLSELIRPISAMVVATVDGSAACRLEYPAPHHACGVDRVRLEEVLLDLARKAGARVQEGAVVPRVRLALGRPRTELLVSQPAGSAWWGARLIVGADGPASIVARSAGVVLGTRHYRRAALTGHRLDRGAAPAGQAMDARLIVGDGWYLGIAPVPGNRVNLGLVMAELRLRRALRR